MQDISVLNNEIDFNCTENFRLSIQLCLNGFSFGIKDDANKEFVLLKHCPFINNRSEYLIDNIKHTLEQEPILKRNFKQTQIIYQSEKKTVIPEQFYSNNSVSDLYSTSNKIESNEFLCINKEPYSGSIIIFSIASDLHQFLTKTFKNCRIVSSIIPLIHYTAIKEGNTKTRILIDNSPKSFFDIIIYEEEKLLLANTQHYVKDIDIAYYILNTIHTLNIDIHNCELIFTGEYKEDSEALSILRKQIRHTGILSIINNRKEFKNTIINNIFANILNTDECELLVEHIKEEE